MNGISAHPRASAFLAPASAAPARRGETDDADPVARGGDLAPPATKRFVASPARLRIGIISNSKSHRNRNGGIAGAHAAGHVLSASPLTREELAEKLAQYAAEGVNLLVIDGGDGTVRDVITAAHGVFDPFPLLAIVPMGKTNALALDLGIPPDWTLQHAIDAACAGQFKQRQPVQIHRAGAAEPELRGFLFGAGGFVRATELAQRTHRLGAFNGLAVGLSLAWSIVQTVFGGAANPWRRGEPMRIRTDDGRVAERPFYTLLASTLEGLPLGLKPFGRWRAGLKVLAIEAPPRHVAMSVPALLTGSEAAWLDAAGYHRADPAAFDLRFGGGFILDGESYEGGDLTIRTGEPLQFVAP